MAKARKTDASGVERTAPRSTEVTSEGITTGEDFARLMSALMEDVIEGRITPNVANAACNAGGKLLKVIEMQYKYGAQGQKQDRKPFMLVGDKAV